VPEVAGIYGRLSLASLRDIMGRRVRDQTKVDEQERICRQIAAGRNWAVAEGVGYPDPNGAYIDNNRSAWQRGRKRPGWDRMLADVEAGLLSHLVIYHGDRLVRQPWDLELLLNFADQRGMIIASGSGDYRLDVPTDRFVLRILTAKACLESDDISRRKKDGFARMALEGIAPAAGGRWGRGFGYNTAGRVPVPEEAHALREAAARVLAGETLSSVAADLSARGVTSVSGVPLDYANLRRVLLRPRIAGLLADGSQGTWEPILERATWEALRVTLEARAARYPNVSSTVRSLLSGVAVCGVCGSGMQRKYSGRTGSVSLNYACVRAGCRKVARNMLHLDAYVGARVVARLNDPRNPEPDIPEPDLAPEWAALTRERAETERLTRDYAASSGRLPLLLGRLDSIDARMAQLRKREAGDSRTRLLERYAGITREDWPGLPLEVRRALVAACYRVTVLPASGRGPGFRVQDVRLDPA
jgi:DNA invertase Pin-like site-specific DNA recombinase